MAAVNAWQRVGQHGGNPFVSMGVDWCKTCGETDTDTQASHRAGVYVYKRSCRRCGRVVKWGTMRAPLLSVQPLPAAAFEWVKKPERDRR